ncbi:hypothetical protein TNCV_4980181 [Trichonephila clavipes]|nr:hypothetical protein TNCV_4980181 [Trichonephila clavipes]
MERVQKSPVTLRCRMERCDVLPAGLFVRSFFEFYHWFYFGISQHIFRMLSSFHGSNVDVDGVVTWRTIGFITPNFFPTLEQYLLFSGKVFLKGCLHLYLLIFFDGYTLSLTRLHLYDKDLLDLLEGSCDKPIRNFITNLLSRLF